MRARRWVLGAVVALGVAVGAIGSGCAEGGSPPVAEITVHDRAQGTPFDRRLLGTNVPAWTGPDRLLDPAFVAATVASGTTVLRMPGGSWSDEYDWLACATGTDGCIWSGAVRPQDYVGFLAATGTEGMWTVNVNSTAPSAAALVAYFNGAVDDERAIGVDRDGVDWQTVGAWARLRVEHGHPQPAGIDLWEIGNEIWAAVPGAQGDCADFGWEEAWTCEGDSYVEGADGHDGFLAMRAAMQAVDPAIAVGAVGVADEHRWGDWGAEVLDAADGRFDFYIVHHYGFDRRPEPSEVLAEPSRAWPEVAGLLRAVDAPVAITEHNLVSFQDVDEDALMAKGVNALFIADTIGQMAVHGIPIANQWNLINGRAENGTDYGMLDDASRAAPQFSGLAMWRGFGDTLVPTDGGDEALGIYASTAAADGSIVVLAINRSDASRPVRLSADSLPAGTMVDVAATAVRTPQLTSTELVAEAPGVDGATVAAGAALPSPAVNVPAPPVDLGAVAMPLRVDLAPYSISVFTLRPG